MNREIKFRGFSEKLNCYIYGFYHEVEAEGIGYSYIFYQGNVLPVRADTVSQFTGFYDFDNKEIYEDDILEYVSFRREESKRLEIVQFDVKCGGWYVHKSADTLADVLFCQHNEEWKLKQRFSINENQRVRVIGNIFQNSDLVAVPQAEA